MVVLMTGATGLVGKRLGERLVSKGYKLRILARDPRKSKKICPFPHEAIKWDGLTQEVPLEHLLDVHAIIHLAGHGIADQRWNDEVKKKLYDSRILATHNLLKNSSESLKIFIGASAIGFYDESLVPLDEEAPQGPRFLSQLCADWESQAYQSLNSQKTRICHLRTGIVFAPKGGALEKMLGPIKWGVGGPLGNGSQLMSWIDIEDLVEMYIFALENLNVQGPINAVAPEVVSNKALTQEIGKILKRPTKLAVPAWALKLAVGELADELLLSQNISSEKMRSLGFKFTYPELLLSLRKNLL